MINFFRKIRQRLLAENKFSKYLFYALGEIVLVVIGIIIALQINNWNESRKIFNHELQLYNKLTDDLNEQFSNTNNKISWMTSLQDLHYQIYNETKGLAKLEGTSAYNSLEWIFPFHLDIAEKYNESLKSISKDEIRDILKYYIRQEKETKDAYDEWNEFKIKRLRPFFNKYGIHNTDSAFNDQPYDFYSLSRNELIKHSKLKEQYGTTELDELLFDLRFKTSWVYSQLEELKSANRVLNTALEAELEFHEVASWLNRNKYSELINEAYEFYESKEYQKSANKFTEAFKQKEVKTSDFHRYNAACSYALAEDIESAFFHLFQLANKSDYRDYEHITSDPDFNILHKDKRWNELITIVKSNKEEAEKGN